MWWKRGTQEGYSKGNLLGGRSGGSHTDTAGAAELGLRFLVSPGAGVAANLDDAYKPGRVPESLGRPGNWAEADIVLEVPLRTPQCTNLLSASTSDLLSRWH